MAEFDKQLLAENGEELTYMITVNGRQDTKEVEILPPLKNVTSVEVIQARVPLSEYTIEYDRNKLVLYYDGAPHTIVLPDQDYSPDSISEIVNTLMPASGITMDQRPNVGKFYMQSVTKAFSVLGTTTCHYPLGLPDAEDISSQELVDASGGVVHYLEFPNRYDLVVSDVVLLQSGDIDTSLTRGNTATNFVPLAEFFLASPGMNDQYSNMDTPYRYFSPIASLDRLNLSFTRSSEYNKETKQVPYNFRGIRWYLKLAIKTKQFKPKPALQPGGIDPKIATKSGSKVKKSTGIRDKSKGIIVPGLGSGMTIDTESYDYLPMASNSSEYM